MATIKSLRLNLKEAKAGHTWLLVPPEVRDHNTIGSYPLPDSFKELTELASILVKPKKQDSGALYLRRARIEWQRLMAAKGSNCLDIEEQVHEAEQLRKQLEVKVERFEEAAERAVARVKSKAENCIASLADLLELGKLGLDGQMRAHINGTEWQGEKITACGFRQCFSMVARAVKNFGLPSKEEQPARESIFREAADSLRAMKESEEPPEGGQPN